MSPRKTMASLTLAGTLTLAFGQAQYLEKEAPTPLPPTARRPPPLRKRSPRRAAAIGRERRLRSDFARAPKERKLLAEHGMDGVGAARPQDLYPFDPPGSGRLDAAAVKREAAPRRTW